MEVDILFLCLLVGVAFIFLLACCKNGRRASPPRSRPPPSSGSGWFSRGFYGDSRRPPPPPYSKYSDSHTGTGSTSEVRGDQERFGFWSGATLGGLGTYFLTRQRDSGSEPRRYDWENDRSRDFSQRDPDYQAPRASGAFSPQQSSSDGRAGPSNLGSMRRSTGFGGSTVR
jgi:SOCE-associated regulatory factor of calcium homoeostasis